jgi:hypothetical protein
LSTEFEIVTKVLNGGGTLVLAAFLWWEFRQLRKEMREDSLRLVDVLTKVQVALKRVLEHVRTDEDSDSNLIDLRKQRRRTKADTDIDE